MTRRKICRKNSNVSACVRVVVVVMLVSTILMYFGGAGGKRNFLIRKGERERGHASCASARAALDYAAVYEACGPTGGSASAPAIINMGNSTMLIFSRKARNETKRLGFYHIASIGGCGGNWTPDFLKSNGCSLLGISQYDQLFMMSYHSALTFLKLDILFLARDQYPEVHMMFTDWFWVAEKVYTALQPADFLDLRADMLLRGPWPVFEAVPELQRTPSTFFHFGFMYGQYGYGPIYIPHSTNHFLGWQKNITAAKSRNWGFDQKILSDAFKDQFKPEELCNFPAYYDCANGTIDKEIFDAGIWARQSTWGMWKNNTDFMHYHSTKGASTRARQRSDYVWGVEPHLPKWPEALNEPMMLEYFA